LPGGTLALVALVTLPTGESSEVTIRVLNPYLLLRCD
jgi:hypothetical protein